MRWLKRHVVFALCLGLGASSGSVPAQTGSMPVSQVREAGNIPLEGTYAKDDSEKVDELSGQSIKFGEVGSMSGFVNTTTIVLRENPESSSPIIAKVKVGEYEAAKILGAKGAFVHVRLETNEDAVADVPRRERGYEGWTTWDSIVPDITALVLDTETGAVVARVPLPDGLTSVTFSPDGTRAMFFSGYAGAGNAAFEVRTSDYTFTRTLASSEDEQVGMLFYGPADGDLYASMFSSKPSVIRIGNDGQPNTPVEIVPDIKVSPDGRLAFVSHGKDGNELTVDVIDLATLQIRNTMVITGGDLASDVGSFVLNKDGSEMYVRSSENSGPISVIDTRTGQIVRELSNPSEQASSYFSQGDLVGDSLLVRVATETDDDMRVGMQNYWVGSGSLMLAEPEVEYVVEAGDKRFAVNDEGTLLFRLDNNNRIQERLKIDRPERGTDKHGGNGLTVFGITASPDGKQIIMFVGTEHGC